MNNVESMGAGESGIVMPVIICDDHIAIREGLKAILENARINVVGVSESVAELLKQVKQHPASIVIVDLQVDGVQFPELIKQLHAQSDEIRVVVYSARKSPVTMGMCYEYGATAYIPKDSKPSDIIKALEFAENGERYFSATVAAIVYDLNNDRTKIISKLSPREMEIFLAYCKEPSIEKIARDIGITEKSLSNAVSVISKKLNISRSMFNHMAQECGLLEF